MSTDLPAVRMRQATNHGKLLSERLEAFQALVEPIIATYSFWKPVPLGALVFFLRQAHPIRKVNRAKPFRPWSFISACTHTLKEWKSERSTHALQEGAPGKMPGFAGHTLLALKGFARHNKLNQFFDTVI